MIEIKNLTKIFGNRKVVDNISFTVGKGEILGFLGPNGAGKSTTMRMITGFLPSSSGTAAIGGCDIAADSLAARKKIGYLPENAPVYPDMTVSGYLNFCAGIRGFRGADKSRIIAETIAKCFLGEVVHQTINTLSKGFKQRVCFAQSILHDPKYLILDEPTDGLDPNQKHEVRQMIHQMSESKTVILSTHILDEVEALCTRAIIIADGKIVVDDTPAGLKSRSAKHGSVFIRLSGIEQGAIEQCLGKIEGVVSIEIEKSGPQTLGVRIYPQSPDAAVAGKIMSALNNARLIPETLFVEQGRLDDVFRSITANPT